ncbi:short chain dehydrogenase, partial [Zopfia rhizophila CBS 207.26]
IKPPYPSPTPTWHNDTYPAIDPTRRELSRAGKTIIVTGAGSGIGRGTAIAFATAGAKKIALLGGTETSLKETQKRIATSTETAVFLCDVTDEAAVTKVAGSVSTWDVLVLNAGFLSAPSMIASADIDDYWKNYEASLFLTRIQTNVKSILIAAKAFFPSAAATGAAVYAITAGALVMPVKMTVGISGYLTSKLAQIKVMEYLAAENPNMFFCSVHPGMIDTSIFRASGSDPSHLPMDTATLPAHFMVWLSHPKTKFLNGRFVFANWDVNELCAKAEEVESSLHMTIGTVGWPFPHIG